MRDYTKRKVIFIQSVLSGCKNVDLFKICSKSVYKSVQFIITYVGSLAQAYGVVCLVAYDWLRPGRTSGVARVEERKNKFTVEARLPCDSHDYIRIP